MAHNHDEIIEHCNQFHAAVYGPEGALDRKTRHLIQAANRSLGKAAASIRWA